MGKNNNNNKKILSKIKENKIILFLFILLIISFISLSILVRKGREKKIYKQHLAELHLIQQQKKLQQQKDIIEKTTNIFKNTNFLAESVLITELKSNKILYRKNHKQKQSIASLTKIMTALIALKHQEIDTITIQTKDLKPNGEYFLKKDETFSKDDLIILMLAESANDAARALSNTIATTQKEFLKEMNALALELNLDSTLLFSDTGLDITSSVGGSYSNALDISKLVNYFYQKYPTIAQKATQDNLKICSQLVCHQIKNTNILLTDYSEIIFSKTGYTNLSQGNLGVIVQVNEKIYSAVVLNSTKEGRFEDIKNIIAALYVRDKFIDSLKKDIN